MLVGLSIQSIALIESIQLEFDGGMTVFTGETGAGKSILLDAIGLVLGERGDTALIRRDAPAAVVEAMFHLDQRQQKRLSETVARLGLAIEDGELLVSRELHRTGRNVCRVNGKMATVQMLRELGERLVEQQGQHESYSLGRADEQLRLLDLYGHHEGDLAAVENAYETWREAHAEWAKAELDEQERMRRLDMLSFQIDEIEAANLQIGEDEQLRAERKRLQNANRIQSMLQSAMDALQGNDGTPGAVDCLADASQNVDAATEYDPSLAEVATLLETAAVHAQEAERSLRRLQDSIDDDPTRLEEVDNRLALIRSLERKYGPSVEGVLEHWQTARRERGELLRHEERRRELEEVLERSHRALRTVADALHTKRVEAASRLSSEITATLQALSMPNGKFVVDIQLKLNADRDPEYSARGCSAVSFLFSANKGEVLRPLSKVASGGELSRLLLGLKSVLAEVDDVDTLIFDEIDTGVSGYAVERLAIQLKSLSRARQVFCVTHSPQVAATADWHWVIRKSEDQTATTTEVGMLSQDGRASEIARLIGGGPSDPTAMAHAVSLLRKTSSD